MQKHSRPLSIFFMLVFMGLFLLGRLQKDKTFIIAFIPWLGPGPGATAPHIAIVSHTFYSKLSEKTMVSCFHFGPAFRRPPAQKAKEKSPDFSYGCV